MSAASIDDWWRDFRAAHAEHREAVEGAYQHLENASLISKVTVHRYLCARGCVRATVIRLGDSTLIRVRDHKQSPGLNAVRSTESARRSRTLDGDRHWPKVTHDVEELAGLGPSVGVELACRHGMTFVSGDEILALVEGISPGHPGAPSLL